LHLRLSAPPRGGGGNSCSNIEHMDMGRQILSAAGKTLLAFKAENTALQESNVTLH